MTRSISEAKNMIVVAINRSWPLANGDIRKSGREYLFNPEDHYFDHLIRAIQDSTELSPLSNESATQRLAEIMDEAYRAIIRITALGCLDYVMLLTAFRLRQPTKSLTRASDIIHQALDLTDILIGEAQFERILRESSPYLSEYATKLIIAVSQSNLFSELSPEQSRDKLVETINKAAHQLRSAHLPLNAQYLTSLTVDLLGCPTFNHSHDLIFLCLYDL
jgi:hypothetical protein